MFVGEIIITGLPRLNQLRFLCIQINAAAFSNVFLLPILYFISFPVSKGRCCGFILITKSDLLLSVVNDWSGYLERFLLRHFHGNRE